MPTPEELRARFGEPWPPIAGTALDIRPDMEAAPWTDLDPKSVLHGQVERIGLLRPTPI